ncbi:MAG: AIR synthase family protein [Deltaproteobacteria bacterium]|nr:AIR synthase family protein [Candidatus Zymogenaceae bacterium]
MTHITSLPSGKLRYELLEEILSELKCTDPRVTVGPRVGEDAAVIDMGDHYLVATADPITFTAENIGYYAINVNANDIAVHGAKPRWFMATILLPLGAADETTVRNIFESIKQAMLPLGINLIGGHTEVTDSVQSPVVSGMMLGEVKKRDLVTTRGCRPGDLIFLTKGIPIEGIAIIAAEKAQELIESGVTPEEIRRARDFLCDPGISVVKDALLASQTAAVTSMHDPTEGGLAAGLNEVALAADVSIVVKRDAIPVYPEGKILCGLFDIDPLMTISSGSLIFTADEKEEKRLETAFSNAGISLSVIGRVEKPSHERVYIENQKRDRSPLPYRERDEILKLFD